MCLSIHPILVKRLPSHTIHRNKFGETKLHSVCKKGDVETVKLLLQLPETLVNAQDHFLWTPLHEASHEGHLEVVRLLLQHRPSFSAAAAAESLGRSEVEKKAGVDLGAKSKEETTPLHDAVLSGRLEVSDVTLL